MRGAWEDGMRGVREEGERARRKSKHKRTAWRVWGGAGLGARDSSFRASRSRPVLGRERGGKERARREREGTDSSCSFRVSLLRLVLGFSFGGQLWVLA